MINYPYAREYGEAAGTVHKHTHNTHIYTHIYSFIETHTKLNPFQSTKATFFFNACTQT